jgi:hypothetical protein
MSARDRKQGYLLRLAAGLVVAVSLVLVVLANAVTETHVYL